MYEKIGGQWPNCQPILDHWIFYWSKFSIFFSNSLCVADFDPKLYWCFWNFWLEGFVQFSNIFYHIEFCFLCMGLLCYQVRINHKVNYKRVCLCVNVSKFAGIERRKTHSLHSTYYSCSSRRRLTAFQGLFFFPSGSTWWMMDNSQALRQSLPTTPPSLFFSSSTLSSTNKRTSPKQGLGLVKLN